MLKLKSALLGYKKTDVCDYIDSLTNDITRKYESEIKKLTEEKEALKKQLKEGSKATDEALAVSGIIIEAQRFAEELKNKAITENEKLTSENKSAADQVVRHIKACEDKLIVLKSSIHQVLTDTDEALSKIQQDLSSLQEQSQI